MISDHTSRTSAVVCALLLGALSTADVLGEDTAAGDADITKTGAIAGDQYGRSVALIGDVNGDGHSEFAVGSRGNNPGGTNNGRVHVYSGISGAFMYAVDGENPSDHFSESLAGGSDIDGDGCPDFIVGAWGNDAGGASAGRAYVFSGLDGSNIYTLTGETSSDNFGDTVARAGDFNNDNFNDFIVGAPTNDANGSNAGRVYVYSGEDGSLIRTFEGENAGNRLGISADNAGDIDKDGFDDIVVGAHLYHVNGNTQDRRGRAYVFSGQDGSTLHHFTGESPEDFFGWSVAGVGDVNNDTYPDVAVGAPLNDALGSNTGRVYVYSGFDWSLLHMFTGQAAVDKLGLAISKIGDANNDGHDDILTGAWWNDGITGDPGDNRGRVYIFSGADGSTLSTFTGEAFKDHMGDPLAGGQDVNGDGVADVITGARDSDAAGVDAGRAYVFYTPVICEGDANDDGAVDVNDISYVLFRLGQIAPFDQGADVNGDGPVDVNDISFVLFRLGTCQ